MSFKRKLLFENFFEDTPAHWKLMPFEEVVWFQEGPGILAKDFVHWRGTPLLRLTNISTNIANTDDCYFLNPELVEQKWSHFKLELGDILVGTSATIGSVSLVDEKTVGAVPYTGIIRMKPKSEILTSEFLRWFLVSREFYLQAEASATGSVIRHYGPSHLRRMTIAVPPLEEQRRLAEKLDSLNSSIHKNKQIRNQINSIIQVLFRSWFIDFDPVKAKAEKKLSFGWNEEILALFPNSLQTSKYGEIPLGWGYVFLEDLATLTKKSINPKRTPEEEFLHYSIPAYDNGANPILTLGDGIESNKFIVPDNCVLLSKLNPKWNRVWIPDLSSDYLGIASTEFLPWVPKNGVSVYYLYSLMVSDPFRWLMDSRISGTTGSHQRVSPNDCAKIPCLMPSLEVMKKFHEAVEKMFEQLKKSAKAEIDLTATRDALLTRLMSGELKVN